MKRYVDTSVLVGFVVNEVHTTQTRHRMQDTRWLNVISDWTVTEFYAVLAFKLRTKQITSEVKREAKAFFEHAKAAMFEIIAVQRSDFTLATALGSRPELGYAPEMHFIWRWLNASEARSGRWTIALETLPKRLA